MVRRFLVFCLCVVAVLSFSGNGALAGDASTTLAQIEQKLDQNINEILSLLQVQDNQDVVFESRLERALILDQYFIYQKRITDNQNLFAKNIDPLWAELADELVPLLSAEQTKGLQSSLRKAIALGVYEQVNQTLGRESAASDWLAHSKGVLSDNALEDARAVFSFPLSLISPLQIKGGKTTVNHWSVLAWAYNILISLPYGVHVAQETGSIGPVFLGAFASHLATAIYSTVLGAPLAVVGAFQVAAKTHKQKTINRIKRGQALRSIFTMGYHTFSAYNCKRALESLNWADAKQ